jgi:ribose 1,5-bisphosphokinase PhnN
LLRRHGKIGIEDDENVAARGVETRKNRVALAGPWLAHGLDVALGISGGNALDLLPGAIL